METNYKKYKEIYIVILTFLLTSVLGTILSNQINNANTKRAKTQSDLAYAREQGKQTMNMVNGIISDRYTDGGNYVTAISQLKDKAIDQKEFEEVRAKYLASRDNWNYNWNLMRVKLKNDFSDELAGDFYDYSKDSQAEKNKQTNSDYWQSMSLTGKFRAFHDAIAKAKQSGSEEDIDAANKIFDALGFDLYTFYDKMEAMLIQGDLGSVKE